MVYYNFNKLANLKPGDILFFDELPNANPAVLNALLTLIESRVMISGDELPDVMIIAAGNWQGMTPMTPQIKERFVWYDIKFHKGMWKEYMNKLYQMPEEVVSKLCDLIKDESNNKKFSGFNFNTPRSLDKAVEMIIFGVPTPYEKEIKHILDTLINNPLKQDIYKNDELIWGAKEKMSWLRAKQMQLNIKFPLEENETKKESSNEILIFDTNDNVIGEVKNIEILQKMYYFNKEDLHSINSGIKIRPLFLPQITPLLFFFKKKLI